MRRLRIISSAVGIVALLTMCAVEPRARIRAEAEGRLSMCLSGARTASQRQQCIDDSKAFCKARGLEPTCGEAGLWTNPAREQR